MGGSPGDQWAGGERQTGEERGGSVISTRTEFKKASVRYLLLLIIQLKTQTQQPF